MAWFSLSTLIVAFAAFGPLYGRAALASVVIAEVGQAPVSTSGIRLVSASTQPGSLLDPDSLRSLAPMSVQRWFGPSIRSSSVGVMVWPQGSSSPAGQLLWREGYCGHVRVSVGRCPGAVGEVLVEAGTAERFGWGVGKSLRISELDEAVSNTDVTPIVTVRVVGIFEQTPTDPFWFDTTLAMRGSDPATSAPALGTLLTDQGTLGLEGRTSRGESTSWKGVVNRVDMPLRPQAVTLDQVLTAGPAVARFVANPLGLAAASDPTSAQSVVASSGFPGLADDVRIGRQQATTTVSLLVGQLVVLLACVLWLTLSAAAQQRRRSAAISRLRGQGASGARRILLGELLAPVLIGIPAGLVLAAGMSWAARRFWFVPRPPLEIDALTVTVTIAAVLVPPALTYLAVRRVSREDVPSLLRGVPPRVSRLSVNVAEAVLAMLALAAFVAVVAGSLVGPLALASPMLLAIAAGVVAARVVEVAAPTLGRVRLTRGRVRSGLSATQAGRRGTARWIVPVASIAVALLVFATQTLGVAVSGYRVQAHADVGAPAVLDVNATDPLKLLSAVRDIDPSGRLATPVFLLRQPGVGSVTTQAVDSAHFPGVAFVAPGVSAAAWARLGPGDTPPVVVRGRTVRMRVASDGLRSSNEDLPLDLTVLLDFVRPDGSPAQQQVTRLTRAHSDHTVSLSLACEQGCALQGFTFQPGLGQSGAVTTFTVGDVTVDGTHLDLGRPTAWLPYRIEGTDTTITPQTHTAGVAFQVLMGTADSAIVNHASVPYSIPALTTSSVNSAGGLTGTALTGLSQPMTSVGTIGYAAGADLSTAVVDVTALSRNGWSGGDSLTTQQVYLSSDDAPRIRQVRNALAAHGIPVSGTHLARDAARQYSRSAAGWSLRLGALIAAMAILVAAAALAAVVATGASASRREYATMRLFGASRRTLTQVAVGELAPVVLLGAIIGAVCGYLAAVVTLVKLPLFVRPPVVDVTDTHAAILPALVVTVIAVLVLLGTCLGLCRWLVHDTPPRALIEADS